MKKMKLMSLALTALAVGACSSDDSVTDGQNGQNGEGVTSYIAVNIANVGETPASRADGDYTAADGTYEDGTEAESAIKKVRFYFFNVDGTPYILGGQSKNWLEESPEVEGQDHDHAIGAITQAVLVINGGTTSAPHSMLAVVNPEAFGNGALGDEAKSLNELKGAAAVSSTFHDATNGFVMSNSVYGEGTPVCEALVANYVKASAEDAEAEPVNIYVERAVAKVSASPSADESVWTLGDDGKYRTKVGKTGGQIDVYAVVEGWGLFNENPSATLFKQLDASFSSTALGITPWSTSDFRRSFWEKSVTLADVQNPSYNELANTLGGDAQYVLPNTPVSMPADPYASSLTHLAVAAKLVYSPNGVDEVPAEICRYRGMEYLGKESVLTQIASELDGKYWVDSDQGKRTLAPQDLTFVIRSAGSYEVVANLASSVGTVYTKDGEDQFEEVASAVVNAELSKQPAEVRNEGMAYYYVPVRHIGTDDTKPGYYGIVRNHAYRVTITGMSGFGTPVYSGDEKLDPKIPRYSEAYLAAKINVLSWRVVDSNVNLDATK